jgi:hypothetical protein
VDDDAHVALVDPHPEGVGGHHHLRRAAHEALLDALPLQVLDAGVVAHRVDPRAAQQRRERVHVLARRCVHDGRALAPAQELQEEAVLFAVVLGAQHVPHQVAPVEPGDQRGRVAQGELADDVAPHLLRGSGGERGDGRVAQRVRTSPRRRYDGRKSCPHSDTQCASSTASSDTSRRESRSWKLSASKRSGAT